ncbi:MAG: SDR family NAD(P)-dependent oxidoreductase [Pseudomonadales bacterium]
MPQTSEAPVGLVTGAATGIGAAVATRLAAQGVRVAICDVNEAAGTALAEQLQGLFIGCDVSSFDSVERAVARCTDELGVPAYAHLNAGIMTVPTGAPYVALEDLTESQYRGIVGVNLDGVFHGLKALLPAMRLAGGGITLTASTAGLSAVPVDPMYTATKYAVIGLGRAVATANENSGVRINVICPGVTDTQIVPDDFRKPEYGLMPADLMAQEIVDLLMQGRNGEVRVKNAADKPAFEVLPPELR